MSVVEPSATGANLIARVKAILLQPKATWDVIDGESATVGGLYRSYIIPLALVPVVCGLIGSQVFGFGAFGISYRPPIIGALVSAVVQFGLSLAHVFVLGLIIDALAPQFGGTKNPIQAFKVAAYAMTASWVAGAFGLIPALGILAIAGLYSLYLLWVGLPKLMKVEAERATAYTALVILAGVVMAIVIMVLVGGLTAATRGPSMFAPGKVSGQIQTPTGNVDLGKLEAATKSLEAASQQMQTGKGEIKLTDPEKLKALLPAAVGGIARTGLSAESGGAGGMGASNAEGVYEQGDSRIAISVTDMGAAGAIAGLAGAFNVQSSREENGRTEKIGKVNGRLTTESYEKASRHGEYSVMVGDRFMVKAEGAGVGMDDLKRAVATIDLGKVEGLSKGG